MFHQFPEQFTDFARFFGSGQLGGVRISMSVAQYGRDAQQLREHAARCRRLAALATDRTFARVLMELADEYLEGADRLERAATAALSQAPPAGPEQRPVQQQQQIQPEDDGD
jgi:hypothetical protein